jgi:1D-myo-inositol-tetrakisphosphate 5-kinase/inositol-polyphosphate multikinase
VRFVNDYFGTYRIVQNMHVELHPFLQIILTDMDSIPQLPPDTEPLEHQVAGHFYGRSKTKFGLLQRCSTGDVLKPLLNPPRGPREYQFYVDMFSEKISNELVPLRPFLPKLLGTYEFCGMTYLILENIIRPYEHPCVIDIKLGRITYDREATPEKIERQIGKFQPAAEIGFQLLGWKTYRQSDNTYIYHDKRCARSLTKDELLYGIAHFFGAPEYDYRPFVRAILDRLVVLEQIMSKQYEFVFIASSLLIVYDGGHRDNLDNIKVDVRLVDFAHVFPSSSHTEPDENFLFGLRHCIEYLKILLDEKFHYVSIDKLNHNTNLSTSTCYKTLSK